jgi:hypothetical protein
MEADMRAPAKDLRVFLDENVYDMTIGPKVLRTLNKTIEFMHGVGKIKSKPKVEDAVDASFLNSVDPSLVQ